MQALPILDSSPVAKFIAIIRQGRYAEMVNYLMSLAERAALAAEREAAKAKAKAKPKKRGPKKRRARQA